MITKRFFFTFLTLSLTSLFAQPFPAQLNLIEETLPNVKVLIRKDSPGALIESKGLFSVFNPENQKKISSGSTGKRYYLQPVKDGIRWGEGFPGVYQITLKGQTDSDHFLIDGIEYEGLISVYNIDETIHMVNELPVESYVKYQLANQFNGDFTDIKLLKALAIVLRTNLYYQIEKNQDAFWQINGLNPPFLGYSQSKIDPFIEEAVDSTQAMVLTYQYRPFCAEWTPHSAGQTAAYPAIFRKNIPSPKGIPIPIAKQNKEEVKWSFSLSKTQFNQLVKIDSITAIDTFEDPMTHRIYAIRIKDGSHLIDYDYFHFQQLIGKNFLKSNLFSVSLNHDQIVFEGYGEGHGVGLCLYSANQMAKKGSTVEQILLHFFPDTLLQQIKKISYSKEGFENF